MTVENISWSISTKECCRPRLFVPYNNSSKMLYVAYLNIVFLIIRSVLLVFFIRGCYVHPTWLHISLMLSGLYFDFCLFLWPSGTRTSTPPRYLRPLHWQYRRSPAPPPPAPHWQYRRLKLQLQVCRIETFILNFMICLYFIIERSVVLNFSIADRTRTALVCASVSWGMVYTVQHRYHDFAYLELPLISRRKSGPLLSIKT